MSFDRTSGRWLLALCVLAVPATASAHTYSSTTDFSTTQGANQWSYLDGDGVPMIYTGAYGGAWHSNAASSGDWCYISRTQQHPGTSTSTKDSIRRWTAPHTGTVTITGSSKMSGPNGGDGAFVIIRKNDGQLFRGRVAPSDTTVGQSWTLTATVLAGDTIDTVVNRGATYWNDEQILTQNITYHAEQLGPEQTWSTGAFYGDRGTVFADVTGDGRADAIAVSSNAVTVRRHDRLRPDERRRDECIAVRVPHER